MSDQTSSYIIEQFLQHLHQNDFPCIAARSAAANDSIKCLVIEHMACPHYDYQVLDFLYRFIDEYRKTKEEFQSAAIIYKKPEINNEEFFDALLWQRLQGLSDLDSKNYPYDGRVDANPGSPHFSYSIKEDAFFIIGLNPSNARAARRFDYPTLVFNPHSQFEHLRASGKYEKMQKVVRKRDTAYSGSINPALSDFGESSEVHQYSGTPHPPEWGCPLKINHLKK